MWGPIIYRGSIQNVFCLFRWLHEASCHRSLPSQSIRLSSPELRTRSHQRVRKGNGRQVLRHSSDRDATGTVSTAHQSTPKLLWAEGEQRPQGGSSPTCMMPETMCWKVRLLNPSLAITNTVYWKNPAGPECVWVPLRITLSLLYREPYLFRSLFRTFKKEKQTNTELKEE